LGSEVNPGLSDFNRWFPSMIESSSVNPLLQFRTDANEAS